MRIRYVGGTALVAAALCVSSCRSPMADAQIAEQMQQLGNELNGLRQDASDMHGQVDSLRMVVARQDTLLRQLAGMAGVPQPVH
jgi:hypothetical protein